MKVMRATQFCAAAATVALALPAAAAARDRDHDGMRDSWEAKFGLNTHRNDARRDRDHDGMRNVFEFRHHMNPRHADRRAGTIASFDAATGTLTINLFGGGTLAGKVDDNTRIECEGADDNSKVAFRHGADDNSGPGSSDDNGRDDDGANHDQNDDRGDRGDENCGPDALTTGRLVKEVDLTGDGTSTIFDEVELGS
jgi:hypothetical protein